MSIVTLSSKAHPTAKITDSWGLTEARKTIEFPNGWGASIIWNPSEFGYWTDHEIAVLHNGAYEACPICWDVIRGNNLMMIELIHLIKSLPEQPTEEQWAAAEEKADAIYTKHIKYCCPTN